MLKKYQSYIEDYQKFLKEEGERKGIDFKNYDPEIEDIKRRYVI